MSPCPEERADLFGWRRDAVPGSHCTCSHELAFHNIETKSQPCGSCDCTRYELGSLRWREVRYITEEIQP